MFKSKKLSYVFVSFFSNLAKKNEKENYSIYKKDSRDFILHLCVICLQDIGDHGAPKSPIAYKT